MTRKSVREIANKLNELEQERCSEEPDNLAELILVMSQREDSDDT